MKKCPLTLLVPLILSHLFAENITVSGKVVDANNNPIQNVNVYNDTKGITTDQNGFFELTVDKKDFINFSHIGFKQITFIADLIPHDIRLDRLIIPSNTILVKGGLFTHKLSESSNSINVISHSEFRSGNDNHFQDLISQIPNLTYASATSRPRYILIRGIGEISQFAGEGPPNYSVGYVIDDVDYSGIGSIGAVFDIEQLEVYKGPHTYAFGPNAMGGIINLQSLNPTPFLSGKTIIGINSDNGNTVGLTVSNSLTQNAAFRFTMYHNYTDGFIYNAYRNLSNTNKQDEKYIRTKLYWKPFSFMSIKLTNLFGNMENGYDAWAPDNNGETTYTDFQGRDELITKSFSLRTNLDQYNYNITSIFSYSDNNINYAFDGDWGNSDYWAAEPYNWNPDIEGYPWEFTDVTNRDRETITHDLRVSKSINLMSNIISGIYIKQLKEADSRKGWLFGGQATEISTEFKINTISLYLNTTTKLTEQTDLNLGSRFNQTKIFYDGTGNTMDNTTWELIPIKSLDTSITTQMIGIQSSIKSRINNSLNVFTSFSRGYKAGGINQNPYLVETQRIYEPEYNVNLSVGFSYQKEKIDILFTAFYMKRYNQQVRLSFQASSDDPLSFDFFTANVAEGFNSGIETSIKYRLTNSLVLNTNAGFLKNHVESYTNPIDPSQINGNREPAHSPAFSYSIIINYFVSERIHFSLENSGMDAFYFEDQYYPKSEYYNIFNSSISLKYDKWDFTLWGKNIFNEKYATKGYYFDLAIGDVGKQSYKMYGEPAHYGLTIKYTF